MSGQKKDTQGKLKSVGTLFLAWGKAQKEGKITLFQPECFSV